MRETTDREEQGRTEAGAGRSKGVAVGDWEERVGRSVPERAAPKMAADRSGGGGTVREDAVRTPAGDGDRPEDGKSGEDDGSKTQKARRREPPGKKDIYIYIYTAPPKLCGGPARRGQTANRAKKHSGKRPLCLVLVSVAVAADPKIM